MTMTKDDAPVAEIFLQLKAKAAKGVPWTVDESATVRRALEKEGEIRVLAACCAVVSGRLEEHARSLHVIRKAVEQKNPSPYVELSIYEALTRLESTTLARFGDAILSFIEQSLGRRAVNLDNTIFLLGRLARIGQSKALEFLQSLAHDSNAEVRDNASRVLQGIERD
ncbi:hypothetical protein NXS98_10280 [Fontisphaera persica]|uniref:hypothetical protein n=1 Tax=Fontisphaera persica TaxID=2974023 RepID=UPI0024BF877B|nr:hypothetical protein [Fontisphaera persica]WCJ58111.1 hypothetical protein NXS98_10280 [Fontisphaera persica]